MPRNHSLYSPAFRRQMVDLVEIVAESLGPALTPTEVARKYAISSGQLYTWRQQVLGG